jgi:hypothetical protein
MVDDAVTAEDLDEEDDGGDEAADNKLVEEIGGAAMAVAMVQISGLEMAGSNRHRAQGS